MKIGYPCINNSIDCTANRTFRLASYSEEKLQEKITENLHCLQKILLYNVKNNLLFFRIGSQLVPFASHPICTFDWKNKFKKQFQAIGNFIKKHNFRISMHPDQFVLINALNQKIIENSIAEISYHCDVLDLMELDQTAKVQIHVGGAYGNKKAAIERFVKEYKKLPKQIIQRLAIENDDRLFSLADCINIHKKTDIPIIFDNLHHECLNNGETMAEAITIAAQTWQKKDGPLMCDYSAQEENERKGKHKKNIEMTHFKLFYDLFKKTSIDADIMLEIKDKEISALKALTCLE